MYPLALKRKVGHKFVLFLAFLGRVGDILLDFGNGCAHIRQHEEIVVIDSRSQHVASLIGHIHGALFLVDDEIQRVGDVRHLALVVLNVVVLHLLEQLLHTRFTEELDERTVFRIALESTEQQHSTLFFIAGGYESLGLVKYGVHQGLLLVVKGLHIRLVLRKLLIITSFHRSRYNQRSPCIVNEH